MIVASSSREGDPNALTPTEVTDLVAFLASCMHDGWAERLLRRGWNYGPVLTTDPDSTSLKHPSLVPFHLLPASEQLEKRNVVLLVLLTLEEWGWSVRRIGE